MEVIFSRAKKTLILVGCCCDGKAFAAVVAGAVVVGKAVLLHFLHCKCFRFRGVHKMIDHVGQ